MQTNESRDFIDDALDVLSDSNRRGMMYALTEGESDQFSYDELVDEMVERGYVDESARETFEVSLTHSHLPKMDEKGVINYDQENGYIERVPHEKVEEIVESLEEIEK